MCAAPATLNAYWEALEFDLPGTRSTWKMKRIAG